MAILLWNKSVTREKIKKNKSMCWKYAKITFVKRDEAITDHSTWKVIFGTLNGIEFRLTLVSVIHDARLLIIISSHFIFRIIPSLRMQVCKYASMCLVSSTNHISFFMYAFLFCMIFVFADFIAVRSLVYHFQFLMHIIYKKEISYWKTVMSSFLLQIKLRRTFRHRSQITIIRK